MENIIDFDRCMEAGALCSTELEFYKRFPLEAKASIMNGWHDEVCANMTVFNRKRLRIYTIVVFSFVRTFAP